jgi:hypothetical protein
MPLPYIYLMIAIVIMLATTFFFVLREDND